MWSKGTNNNESGNFWRNLCKKICSWFYGLLALVDYLAGVLLCGLACQLHLLILFFFGCLLAWVYFLSFIFSSSKKKNLSLKTIRVESKLDFNKKIWCRFKLTQLIKFIVIKWLARYESLLYEKVSWW